VQGRTRNDGRAFTAAGVKRTGNIPSPWLNLGMLGIQPRPAMPTITTLAPQYITIAPSASNAQIPLAYLVFKTWAIPIALHLGHNACVP
jgi:hypothetical protein